MLFPAIILLSIIMPGLTQATRLTRWREDHIFERFALTPVPLSKLMAGTALTQILIGVGQGMLMLLFGIFIVGMELSLGSAILVLGGMILAGAIFIAFGSLIAGYVFFIFVLVLVMTLPVQHTLTTRQLLGSVLWRRATTPIH